MPCFEVENRRPGHDNAVRLLRFTPSGSEFLSMAVDSLIKRWDTESGELLENISLEDGVPWDARSLRRAEEKPVVIISGRRFVLKVKPVGQKRRCYGK